MAFRINTVEYGWETNQTVVTGSVPYTGPNKLITIPETGSRTFLSVDVEMYVRDATLVSIGSISSYGLSCSIDANLGGAAMSSQTITATGDHMTLIFKQSFTDHFNARFTGSSHVVSPRWTANSSPQNLYTGHSYRLIATYQYDDANISESIKTVRLPLDAIYGTLTTTQRVFGKEIGGYANIPSLDSYLPEASKSYKDVWIQYTGCDIGAATQINMITQIDSGSEVPRYTMSGSLTTDTYYFDIQNVSGTLDTSTSHTLSARATSNSRMTGISPTLFVTYTYRSDLTTSVLNSLMLPLNDEYYSTYSNGILNNVSGYCTFLIPEREPSLCHSALVIMSPPESWSNRSVSINNVLLASGNQSRQVSAATALSTNYRFDSNAATSSDCNLVSGFNVIPISFTAPSNPTIDPFSGYFILNYTSSILNSGIHGHQKMVYFGTGSFPGYSSLAGQRWSLSPTESIHSNITGSYYINGFIEFAQGNGTTVATSIVTGFDYTGSLNQNISLYSPIYMPGTTEQGVKQYATSLSVFKHWSNQSDSDKIRLDYFKNVTTRMVWPGGNSRPAWTAVYAAYQQNIIRVTGSLGNCNFTTTDYAVDIYLSGSNTPNNAIYNLTSTGSGASKTFMFDWYEDINRLYAVTKYPEIGISNLATASNANILTIDYGTPSAGGEKSFTFIG